MASSSRMGPGGGLMQLETPVASGTTTATQTPPEQAVLHLRGAEPGAETGRRIQWADDVVDNEKMGKKKSKVCCIYHAPRGIDESSDESSSDSSSDDSDSDDDGGARPAGRAGGGNGHGHGHEHDHDHGKGKGDKKGKGKGGGTGRSRSPNAYEKVPKARSGGTK